MMPRRSRRSSGARPRPLPLAPGMTVALAAPAGSFPSDRTEKIRRLFEEKGFRVVIGRHVTGRDRYLAGSDADRAVDLIRALTDPSVDAVFAIRGGYGSSRLLPRLPFGSFPEKPKIFCGYSDITFLHAALGALTGWITFHGPNAIEFADDPIVFEETLAYLSGSRPLEWHLSDEQILQEGKASGIVAGGNLTCFSHLMGTPYAPSLEGALLLLEDKAEPTYRVDRMLMHLKAAGVFHRIGGIIGGTFTDCGDPDEIRMLLREYSAPRSIPVVLGLPFGHGARNHVLPLGARFTLDTSKGTLTCAEVPWASR